MARIVIALDPGTASVGGLELVRYLSRESGAELLGLLIEDISVLEHAQSHLAREVLLSGAARQLEATLLEKQIRAQIAGVRAKFERAAGQLGLRHGFHVMRGEMISELIKSAADAQALIVDVQTIHQHVSFSASITRLMAARTPALVFAKERWPSRAGIVAVIDSESRAASVLGVALPLAAGSRLPLTLLVPGIDGGSESELQSERALLARIGEIYAAHGREPDPIVGTDLTQPANIVRAVAQARAGLLVMPRRETEEEGALVAELLEKTSSSLLLVS